VDYFKRPVFCDRWLLVSSPKPLLGAGSGRSDGSPGAELYAVRTENSPSWH
jgi:hypothetical protein